MNDLVNLMMTFKWLFAWCPLFYFFCFYFYIWCLILLHFLNQLNPIQSEYLQDLGILYLFSRNQEINIWLFEKQETLVTFSWKMFSCPEGNKLLKQTKYVKLFIVKDRKIKLKLRQYTIYSIRNSIYSVYTCTSPTYSKHHLKIITPFWFDATRKSKRSARSKNNNSNSSIHIIKKINE